MSFKNLVIEINSQTTIYALSLSHAGLRKLLDKKMVKAFTVLVCEHVEYIEYNVLIQSSDGYFVLFEDDEHAMCYPDLDLCNIFFKALGWDDVFTVCNIRVT